MVAQPRKNVKKTAKNTSKEGGKSSKPIPKSIKVLGLGQMDRIPRIDNDQIYKRSIMYQTTGAVNGQFTLQSGIIQFMLALNVNTVVPGINMYRIRRIRAWSNVGGSTNEGYCEITPLGEDVSQNNFNSPPQTFVDTTNSATYTAHLDVRLTEKRPSGSWHNAVSINTGQPLFQLVCSNNTTIIIDYDILFGFSQPQAMSFTQSVVGAVAGTWYCRQPIINLAPVGLNVI